MTDNNIHTNRFVRRWWRGLSIRWKLVIICTVTSMTVLLASITILFVYDRAAMRQELKGRLNTLSEVMAFNIRAALAFNDRDVATNILSALEKEPRVRLAIIYDAAGNIFSHYRRPDVNDEITHYDAPEQGAFKPADRLCFKKNITLEDETIGSLFICRSTSDYQASVRHYIITISAVIMTALLAAWLMSLGLQRIVSTPILNLTNAATNVLTSNDYKVRANKKNNDEIGRLVEEFNRMLDQIRERDEKLVERQERLSEYRDKLRSMASQLILTEQEERQQIARDLHDSVCQLLWASKLKLDLLLKKNIEPNTQKVLQEIHELVKQSLHESRTLTFEISPPDLHQLGLESALEMLSKNVKERHGITVSVTDDKYKKPLTADIRTALFRSVQELLMNVVKHAGTMTADIGIMRSDSHIKIVVADKGKGFDTDSITDSGAKSRGFGLFSIRERIDYMGGQMYVQSSEGEGTQITLLAPLSLDG